MLVGRTATTAVLTTSVVAMAASAWKVTFSQLYPRLRQTLQTYSFTGLNLFPASFHSGAFNYSRLVDAVRADFGREFIVALDRAGDRNRQLQNLGGIKDKFDWHILYGTPSGGFARFLGETALDPARVMVLVNTAHEVGLSPVAETVDTEESISAQIGGLVGEVPTAGVARPALRRCGAGTGRGRGGRGTGAGGWRLPARGARSRAAQPKHPRGRRCRRGGGDRGRHSLRADKDVPASGGLGGVSGGVLGRG